MAWLLFMDESGHDHKQMPLEVRGGVALHISKLWDFIRAWQRLEFEAFGARPGDFKKELKGSKLLDRDRFRWAGQAAWLDDNDRRKHARAFLAKGAHAQSPNSVEFLAYGQACIEMARGIFEILISHEARLFAAAIPRGVRPPSDFQQADYLRKDHVFLFERFFYFLEAQRDHGLLVMDETDKSDDRRFVARVERYFGRTQTGRQRTAWIVPAPLFVSSDMSVGIQSADLCLYTINWGFRLPGWEDIEPARPEIVEGFAPQIRRLQWHGDGYRDGHVFRTFGVVLVPDPYGARPKV
jgi:hypothetical protein